MPALYKEEEGREETRDRMPALYMEEEGEVETQDRMATP